MSRRTCFRAFTAYLRLTWPDLVSLLLISLLMGGLYLVPLNRRQFRVLPLYRQVGGTYWGPEEISYPYVEEIISSPVAAGVVVGIPVFCVGLFQIKLRSWWDFHAGVTGVLKALIAATFVQVILKNYVGGFRPNFLDICRPDLSHTRGQGYEQIFFPISSCTGMGKGLKEDNGLITYGLQSFPSGHTAAAFAAAVFLSLYVNAKFKCFADYSAHFWKYMVCLVPLIGAALISGGLWVDHHHHAHDLLGGLLIGLMTGVLAYRSSYASLLDPLTNHIPLPPENAHTRFSYAYPFSPPPSAGAGIIPRGAVGDGLVMVPWWTTHDGVGGGHGGAKWREKENLWFRGVRRGRDAEMGMRLDGEAESDEARSAGLKTGDEAAQTPARESPADVENGIELVQRHSMEV
ncbi:MAG: hypothetical protein M1817_006108 [Caeruleum heppii]|nr:MAG: hypothetical protein M1817_006108 [Caeruleum heppii]